MTEEFRDRRGVSSSRSPKARRSSWQLAGQFCTDDCHWYHGPRLYLRALGIIRGIEPDSSFMLDAIGPCGSRRRDARVLMSGCADHGMLAHVVTAFGAARRP